MTQHYLLNMDALNLVGKFPDAAAAEAAAEKKGANWDYEIVSDDENHEKLGKRLGGKRLLVLFNNITGESVSRFSDTTAGAKRLLAALSSDSAKTAKPSAAKTTKPAAGKGIVAKVKEAFAGQPKEKKPAKTAKERLSHSERADIISKTWKNEKTAAVRAKRDRVEVNGSEFRSVCSAFRALGLPMGVHIPFRIQVKEAKGKVVQMEHGGKTYSFMTV